jgi:hypothetical protein
LHPETRADCQDWSRTVREVMNDNYTSRPATIRFPVPI